MSQLAICSALEIVLDAMPGMVPASNIVSSNNGVFITDVPHGLVDGIDVKISGHTSLNLGRYFVVNSTVNTFQLLDKMTSRTVVIPAGSGGAVLAQLTAWENVGFAPVNGYPFQKVNFIFSQPDNTTMGDAFYRERGYMQVTLCYPQKTGKAPAMSRAELIRKTYPRGASFSKDGITVRIDGTATVLPNGPIDESYVLFVRVPFHADIFN